MKEVPQQNLISTRASEITVKEKDIDPNNHVNNAAYFDFMQQQTPSLMTPEINARLDQLESSGKEFVAKMSGRYIRQVYLGNVLSVRA